MAGIVRSTNVDEIPKRSVLVDMAARYGMEPAAFEQTLRATVVPKDCSKEQFAAFLLVAKEYGLNPMTKEIYAFPSRTGGIQPIVSVDGWLNIINSHPQLNGIEFDDHLMPDGKTLTAITARIWRKDRDKPVTLTEYLVECDRSTEPWKKWPRRMLRHKALIQCARYAFGFAGIVDPDEAERFIPAKTINHDRDNGPPAPPQVADLSHQNGTGASEQPPKPQTTPTPQIAIGLTSKGYPDPKQDLDGFLKFATIKLRGAKTPDELNDAWNTFIDIHSKDVFPPDMEDLMWVFRQKERELEQ